MFCQPMLVMLLNVLVVTILEDAHSVESGREDKESIPENFPYNSLENKDVLDEIRNFSPMVESPNAPFLSMKVNFKLNVYEANLLGNHEQIQIKSNQSSFVGY